MDLNTYSSVTTLAGAIRNRELSSEEAMSAYLSRRGEDAYEQAIRADKAVARDDISGSLMVFP
ncbi:MAG TPA: hypothetical protein PLA74_08730 [Syntrophales bacterium]|nr:hypothetical protein [Syntrophales bacterium]HPQ43983.1 hypothetical protein [Syntrophales bacterium]